MGDDDEHLRRAIELAAGSARAGGGPFGAVVVRDGRVLAEETNRVVESSDPTAHAEVRAIRAAAERLGTHVLAGCTLYSSCEPCPMCLGAIHWARVERLVFAADRLTAAAAGFDDRLLYEQLGLPPEARRLPTLRSLADEGERPFAVWRANADRVPY